MGWSEWKVLCVDVVMWVETEVVFLYFVKELIFILVTVFSLFLKLEKNSHENVFTKEQLFISRTFVFSTLFVLCFYLHTCLPSRRVGV